MEWEPYTDTNDFTNEPSAKKNNFWTKLGTGIKNIASNTPWGSIIGAGASIFNSIYNAKMQEKTNQANRDWTEKQTQAQWAREDTAHQREVADLQKAGLSPLAALGGAPSTAPLDYEAQAPQMDLSGAIGATMNMDTITNEKNQMRDQLLMHRESLESNKNLEIKKLKENARQFDINNSLMSKKMQKDIEMFNENMTQDRLKVLSAKFDADTRNWEEKTGGKYERTYCTTEKDYINAMNNFLEGQAYNDQQFIRLNEAMGNGMLTDEGMSSAFKVLAELEGSAGGSSSNKNVFFNIIEKLFGGNLNAKAGLSTEEMKDTYSRMSVEQKKRFWELWANNPYLQGKIITFVLNDGSDLQVNFRKVKIPIFIYSNNKVNWND